MNELLPSRYTESIRRGAVAVELFDAVRFTRVLSPLRVWREGPPPSLTRSSPWPYLDKRIGYLHALYYPPRPVLTDPPVPISPIDLRFFDETRHYVPRRLRFAVDDDHTVADTRPPRFRQRPVTLYPGAAYPYDACATGLRGRVTRAGRPVRWVRVQAVRGTNGGPVVGRAHGDDRGEFLLILGADAAPPGELPATIQLTVTVFAPAEPDPATYADDPFGDELRDLIADPRRTGADPFGDITQEPVDPPTGTADKLDPDPVLLGEELPTGYSVFGTPRRVTFTVGQVRHDEPEFTP